MIDSLRSAMARRSLAGALVLGTALTACAAQAASFTMYRDPNCGCCLAWAGHVERGGVHDVEAVNHTDMAAVKAAHGVPADLLSCHTAVVDGYVIEGHVPVADIERLLAERPEGIAGLAVAAVACRLKLEFVALARERFDLVIGQREYFEAPFQALLEFARGDRFHRHADELGGYDLAEAGRVVYVGP